MQSYIQRTGKLEWNKIQGSYSIGRPEHLEFEALIWFTTNTLTQITLRTYISTPPAARYIEGESNVRKSFVLRNTVDFGYEWPLGTGSISSLYPNVPYNWQKLRTFWTNGPKKSSLMSESPLYQSPSYPNYTVVVSVQVRFDCIRVEFLDLTSVQGRMTVNPGTCYYAIVQTSV